MPLSVQQLTSRIGARVVGVDLSADLDAALQGDSSHYSVVASSGQVAA